MRKFKKMGGKKRKNKKKIVKFKVKFAQGNIIC